MYNKIKYCVILNFKLFIEKILKNIIKYEFAANPSQKR